MAEPDAKARSRERRRVLARAARAARAASLVIADRRCDAGDAVPLLIVGWQRLHEATADASAAEAAEDLRADPAVTRQALRKARRALNRALRRARAAAEPIPFALLRAAIPLALVVVVAVAATSVAGLFEGRARRGWRGAYYPQRDFAGEAVVQHDLAVRFHWFDAPPLPGFPRDQFSVRWDTCLELPSDQTIEMRVGSDDGARVRIDGEEVIDLWDDHGFIWNVANVELETGAHHAVVEYYDRAGKAAVEVKLRLPGLPAEPLPLAWRRVPRRPVDHPSPCE